MAIKHILKLILKHKSISLLITLQIAIAVTIVGNTSFISYRTLQNWLVPSHIAEEQIINVYTRAFDKNLDKGALIERDLQRLKALPGVESASYAGNELVLATVNGRNFAHNTLDTDNQGEYVALFAQTQGGAETLGVNISQGRHFYDTEYIFGAAAQNQRASVVMISNALAKKLFPQQSALGQTVYLHSDRAPYQVIAIYDDMMLGETAVYTNNWYHSAILPEAHYGRNSQINYLVKVAPNTDKTVLETIEDLLFEEDGRIVQQVEFAARAKKRLWDGRSTFAFIMMGISGIAILVTGVGIIALVSFSISVRKKEIGVLRALGASQSRVMQTLLIENSILAIVGIILGLFAALWLNQYFVTNLRIQGLIVPWLAGLVALCVWLLSATAVYIPARKAARIAPAQVTKTS
ncbi:ABC transporter permease [Pseudoalteromonas obscura]|uniref:ABC transporter permease n=1 Tax=Pseudoalteromonas obscura TaxID=3048491 RepID=A0ABT7EGZ1_9GAMM|nr:FtsX-like permease family protein [Pseudoalteromonas sp. P94(2023)]MDK2594315.1 ABC transporter permease [Pseudoalteromonas sp. P94(2023)]